MGEDFEIARSIFIFWLTTRTAWGDLHQSTKRRKRDSPLKRDLCSRKEANILVIVSRTQNSDRRRLMSMHGWAWASSTIGRSMGDWLAHPSCCHVLFDRVVDAEGRKEEARRGVVVIGKGRSGIFPPAEGKNDPPRRSHDAPNERPSDGKRRESQPYYVLFSPVVQVIIVYASLVGASSLPSLSRPQK